MRCSLGAVGVGIIEKIIEAINEGPAFSILAGVSFLSSGMLFMQWKYGERWIAERAEKERETDQGGI